LAGKEKAEFIDDLAILSRKKYERQKIEAGFYILGYHIGTFCRISGISKNKINWSSETPRYTHFFCTFGK
jgi:hypothetical protein